MPRKRTKASKAVKKPAKPPEPPKPIGRPSDYNAQIAEEICTAIATSSIGLRKLLDANERFPGVVTLYRWLHNNEDFRKQYACAREQQAQVMFDELTEIADNTQSGQIVKLETLGDGSQVVKREITQKDMTDHRRLQIDTRKWVLAKMLPKKYGDRIEVDANNDPLLQLISQMNSAYKIASPDPEGAEPVPADVP